MIINCKQIILILALFILTSCKNYVISKKDIDLVKNNEKALVVSVSRISTYSNKDYLPAYIVWKNTSQKNIHRTLWVTDPKNYLEGYSLCSYILEPGEYNIKEIISMKNDFFSDTTISTYYVAGLAKFSIKGGEVIYLGNITFYHNRSKIVYEVTDEYDYIYKEAKKLFPMLQPRLTKRLLTK